MFDLSSIRTTQVRPLFPTAQYRTLAEAQGQLKFTPLLPANLPTGFSLAGVWVFPESNRSARGSVLLRYSDSGANFILYESPSNKVSQQLPKMLNRRSFQQHIQRWKVAQGDGEMDITFIGPLAPDQAQALYESLRR